MKRYAPYVLVLILASSMVGYAQSSTAKKKAASLTSALKKVKAKKSTIQKQLRTKKAETQQVMDEIHSVDDRMSVLENRIDRSASELKGAQKEQVQLAADLRAKTQEFDGVRVEVKKRLRAIYSQGEASSISILVGTQSLSDLASRKALVERIADRDRALFLKVRQIRDAILAKKKEQDRIVAKIAELKASQEKDLTELETVRKKKKSIFNILSAQQDELEDQLAAMEEESRKLESQIFQYQATTGGSTPIFKGKFIRPVNGRQSSGFGVRIHPISRTRRMHTGIDIAAPGGTTIVAAGSGRVISAGWIRGYGNTVVLDHGGGISTLYGHCSRLYVGAGQSVSQGEKIAAVGSTGNSTGNHLHFEVRINGKPVNPAGR